MFAVNPGVLAAGAGATRTYEDWVAHTAARAPTLKSESTSANLNGVQRVQMGIAAGNMWGSPYDQTATDFYGARFEGALGRAVQHALPSLAEVNSQRANGGIVLVSVTYSNAPIDLSGSNRHGYMSLSLVGATFHLAMIECSWWNFTLNKPQTCNPQLNTAAVDYVGNGW